VPDSQGWSQELEMERAAASHETDPGYWPFVCLEPQFTRLGLSERVRHRLWRYRIYTVAQLTGWTRDGLLAKSGFGVVALVEVERLMASQGLSLKPVPRAEPKPARVDERLETMRSMRAGGATLEEIGRSFGITRERVRQLLKKEARNG
jgi:hypothetical protein